MARSDWEGCPSDPRHGRRLKALTLYGYGCRCPDAVAAHEVYQTNYVAANPGVKESKRLREGLRRRKLREEGLTATGRPLRETNPHRALFVLDEGSLVVQWTCSAADDAPCRVDGECRFVAGLDALAESDPEGATSGGSGIQTLYEGPVSFHERDGEVKFLVGDHAL